MSEYAVLKVAYEGTTRRVQVLSTSLNDHLEILRERFGLPSDSDVHIKWVDEDGDLITMSNDLEFVDCLRSVKGSRPVIRVHLYATSLTPAQPNSLAAQPQLASSAVPTEDSNKATDEAPVDKVEDDDYEKVDLVSESGSEDDVEISPHGTAINKGKAREHEQECGSALADVASTDVDNVIAAPEDVDSAFTFNRETPSTVPDLEDAPLDNTTTAPSLDASPATDASDPPCDALPTSRPEPTTAGQPLADLAQLLDSLLPASTAASLSTFFTSPNPAAFEQLVREASESIPAVLGRVVDTTRAEAGRVAQHVRAEADSVRAEFERAKREVENVRREFEEEVKKAAAEVARQARTPPSVSEQDATTQQAGSTSSSPRRTTAATATQTAPAAASASAPTVAPSAPSQSPRDDFFERKISSKDSSPMPGAFVSTSSHRPAEGPVGVGRRTSATREQYPAFHIPGAFHSTGPEASTSRLGRTPTSVKELKAAVKEMGFNPDKSLGVRIACERVWDRHRGDSLETMTAAVVAILCE